MDENKTTDGIVKENEELSLNDDRRVKTLSPWALVRRRFIRNRVAVTGLIILICMFLFAFLGGAITPYGEAQLFYRYDEAKKQYAAVKENTDVRYTVKEGAEFPALAQAKLVLARKGGDSGEFEADGVTYSFEKVGEDCYSVSLDGEMIAFGTAVVLTEQTPGTLSFEEKFAVVQAVASEKDTVELEGKKYDIDAEGNISSGSEVVATASKYIISALMGDVNLTDEYKEQLIEAIESDKTEFNFKNEEGQDAEYFISYDAGTKTYSVLETVETKVFDTYSSPSKEHWLGTDRNGMDMLTRLMYGGRVSLYIGFIVVFLETFIGVIMGGISGYFGKWVDMLIMRIVDVFYCIPGMPIIIILGAAMDAMRVDPQIRMIYLMLLMGILGWAGIARLVRGQILSLREQEFMTAAEATGIRASRRIFKHLIPNVIPQLIVTMTMGLGDTIIMESTLSFLGLGVKFPFASWGNIINDVNDTYVLTNYWFIWIPAGVCLLVTVLAFNLVGDGLRDAFDPKMKR